MKDKLTKEWLEKEYVEKQRSFQEIAEECHTYPNAIRRRAIKFGIKPRDRSAAQAIALKEGRHAHPTKGKKRSEEDKIAISEGQAKSWQNLTDEQYDSRVQKAKDNWESMTPDERAALQKLAIDAVRKTSREGSGLEKFLVQHLKDQGFLIEFHRKGFLNNPNLEVDLFLPSNNIAIEVDGPSHFLPIWGDVELQKTRKADNEKNGLLLLYKINVVRIKQLRKNLSMKNMRDIAEEVTKTIRTILDKSKQKADIYEIEVQ